MEELQIIATEHAMSQEKASPPLDRALSYADHLKEKQLDNLVCPISHQAFRDPVVASDGHTYELECLVRHFEMALRRNKAPKSPITNEALAPTVYRNRAARNTLDTLMQRDDYDIYERPKQEGCVHLPHVDGNSHRVYGSKQELERDNRYLRHKVRELEQDIQDLEESIHMPAPEYLLLENANKELRKRCDLLRIKNEDLRYELRLLKESATVKATAATARRM